MRLNGTPPPASRARFAPAGAGGELRNVAPERALSAWLEALERSGRPARLPSVRVPITEARGRVTAEPVWALRSSPAFPAAAMDGIAVRAAATAGAAPGRPVRLAAGSFDVVDTGDPLSADRDAVAIREGVHIEHGVAAVEAAVSPGRHVRPIGEDVAAGELLFAPGHRLRPMDLAAAAAAGVTELTVRRRAIVAILPTGDELRPAGASLASGELADTNSLMLDGQAREAGCETRRWPILPDEPERLAAALRTAAAEADLVVLVAGTSAGRHDHAPGVLSRCGRILVHGVAMRPGHPVLLGVVDHTPVVACPGYPVSAALAFDGLALPLLASLEGAAVGRPPAADTHLAVKVASKRGSLHRLCVKLGTVDGRRVAVPLRGGASVLTSLVHADALISISAERDALLAGAAVPAELLRPTAPLDGALLLAGTPDRALDLLALAVADAHGAENVRVAFCEMAPEQAVALVRDGVCHAAAVAVSVGAPTIDDDDGRLVVRRLAECEVALALAADGPRPATPNDLLRTCVRVAVAPPGTPARRVLEDARRETGACAGEIAEVRSDAAALATVAAGHASCAASTLPAARRAGLATIPLGRAALDLVIHNAAGDGDPSVRALLDTLGSPSLAVALRSAGYDPAPSVVDQDAVVRR